jgi:hypothetical protein
MECPNCHLVYNDEENCPRLLTTCGHSLCESCLKAHFFDGAILCTECKKLNRAVALSMFPKNLALITVKTPTQNPQEQNFNMITESILEIKRDPSLICTKHNKRVEGTVFERE